MTTHTCRTCAGASRRAVFAGGGSRKSAFGGGAVTLHRPRLDAHAPTASAMSSSKVNSAQVAKAVAALSKHLEKVKAEGKAQLFDGDGDDGETYSVMVSTRRASAGEQQAGPHQDSSPAAQLGHRGSVPHRQGQGGRGHKEAKKKVAEMEKCGVAKVLGILKLRNNYKPHEAKRKLCDSYDMFMADARIILLPKLLGKSFFKKKRQPVPVDLTKRDWPAQIRKAAAATYVHMGAGTAISVKVGRTHQSVDEITENAVAAIANLVR